MKNCLNSARKHNLISRYDSKICKPRSECIEYEIIFVKEYSLHLHSYVFLFAVQIVIFQLRAEQTSYSKYSWNTYRTDVDKEAPIWAWILFSPSVFESSCTESVTKTIIQYE